MTLMRADTYRKRMKMHGVNFISLEMTESGEVRKEAAVSFLDLYGRCRRKLRRSKPLIRTKVTASRILMSHIVVKQRFSFRNILTKLVPALVDIHIPRSH